MWDVIEDPFYSACLFVWLGFVCACVCVYLSVLFFVCVCRCSCMSEFVTGEMGFEDDERTLDERTEADRPDGLNKPFLIT